MSFVGGLIVGLLLGALTMAVWFAITRSDVNEDHVLGFCGWLTADIPELHGIHPQQLALSWSRFKARVEEGFDGLDFGGESG